jgi:hypothetical protein
MEVLSSSETPVLTRATRRNIPENGILHSHRSENLKSYKILVSSVHFVYELYILFNHMLRYKPEGRGFETR